jgi:CHAT domain-containing protein/tetratricopeptide (TPR) repeat protein
MKLILITCLFFLCTGSRAQNITDMVLEAGQLFQSEEYEKAIPAAEKALNEIEKVFGKDNILYTGMLTVQAYSYFKTFRYNTAESLYIELCNIHKKPGVENEQHYATCLNNMATMYVEMGLYEKAEPILIESKDLTKKLTGEIDSAYSYSLNNLAALYHSMGQYQKAEPLYLLALEIRKKVYGTQHEKYGSSLNNLGSLYLEMGQFAKALPFFTQSRTIWSKASGETHPDFAMVLNNIASTYEAMEQYTKAEPLYVQANNIRKRSLSELHPDYAMGLNNLASLYTRMEQFKKAEGLIVQAKNIWKNVLGENHPNYATGVNNQAAFYRRSRTHYAEAELLYKLAITLRKKSLGPTHPLTGDTENDLALLYSNLKQYEKAEPYLLSASQTLLKNMLTTFTVFSEKEKGNYLDYNFVNTEINNSFLYNYSAASPEMITNSFNLQLGFKSVSLADTRNLLEAVRKSKDTAISRLFTNWKINKILLAKQYSLPVGNRMENLAATEDWTEALEKELNRRSSEFRDQQTALKISQQDIQGKMLDDEAAIEFVRFRLYTDRWTDSIIYAAYILRKNDRAPVFVPLCTEKQIDKISMRAIRSATGLARVFYQPASFRKPGIPTAGDSLYQLIWKPLEKYLDGIKKISYSPAGKFYGIAFHALPVDTGNLLIDRFQLEQYTSTRQIALRQTGAKDRRPSDIVLFGDALFTMDSISLVKRVNKAPEKTSVPIDVASTRSSGRGIWMNLPGTAEEVKRIRQLFEDQKISTKTFIQSEASEENLKSLNGQSPAILHVATHGFFLPESVKKEKGANNYTLANDPLLRSGLVFAGGNYVWGGKSPLNGIEDGIATAYEISQLNLSNTDLVVLSACETALGDVKGSEGVFGLQRSFKMAGVKNLVVSLWQVPDKETVELMTAFYTYRMSGKNIAESFYQAQSDMRNKYPPFYWAAFVLVE